VNIALLVALIQNLAIPELMTWLKSRQEAGDTIDDAAILEKLKVDTDEGIRIGQAWLDAHKDV
jgi:hypothetical protein